MRPLWVVFGLALSISAGAQPREDPRATSIHPFFGQRGATFSATLRGNGLAGARAASLENAPFTVAVEGVEPEPPVESAGRKTRVDLVKLRVDVRPDAKPGRYPFRLITRNGISNALSLEVVDGPAHRAGHTRIALPRGRPARSACVPTRTKGHPVATEIAPEGPPEFP